MAESLQEISRARYFLIYLVQREAFPGEIKTSSNEGSLLKKNRLTALNPFLDEGILRVGGRMKHSLLSHDQKFPIILPAQHHLT